MAKRSMNAKKSRRRSAASIVHRDIIVIGASAGGVETVRNLLATLPATLPATLFIVVHMPPDHPSMMPRVVAAKGGLPVKHASDGEAIKRGHVYVAPPDHHLLVERERMRVVRGPRENGQRPAVDALFRTAARTFGERVVGIVLSGTLDCGSIGLRIIKAAGGNTIVQQPEDALFPDMPRNAMRQLQPDYVVPITQIGAILQDLVARPLGKHNGVPLPHRPHPEIHNTFTCPECGGTLSETQPPEPPQYQCKTGHLYSPTSLDYYQSQIVEAALWAALRALKDRADLTERFVGRADPKIKNRMLDQAESLLEHARVIEHTLLNNGGIATPHSHIADVAHDTNKRPRRSKSTKSAAVGT